MAIDSINKLRDWIFRRLGAPVINIEVDNQQANERIQEAIQKFITNHYDGSVETFNRKTITYADQKNGYIDLDPSIIAVLENMNLDTSNQSGSEVFDDLDWNMWNDYYNNGGSALRAGDLALTDWYISREYFDTLDYLFNADTSFTFNSSTGRFKPTGNFSSVAYYIPCTFANVDNPWIETNATLSLDDKEYINGETIADTITSSGAGTFGITFTETTKTYQRGTYTIRVMLLAGTAGDVTIALKDRNGTVINSSIVTPETYWKEFYIEGTYEEGHINDIVVDISATATGAGETFFAIDPILWKNNFLLLHAFKSNDAEEHANVYDNEWLKKYAFNLVKEQWGHNTKKFDGVMMPGGVTLNGQQIYDEAVAELEKLDEELELKHTLPVDFMIG